MFASKFASKKAVVLAVIGAFVVAGAAFAYWTAGGSGTGTASTGSTTPLTVVQTSTISNMYPGDSPQTLSGTFTNPNSGPIFVGRVTPSVASVAKSTGPGVGAGPCTAADYTVTEFANVNREVAAGNADTWSGGKIQFNNTGANQDGCKGATVTLSYTISGG